MRPRPLPRAALAFLLGRGSRNTNPAYAPPGFWVRTKFFAFKEIGGLLGPFDLAAVPIWAYMPAVIMRSGHTTPEEALQLFEDVRGRRFVGIHWRTFDLAEEPIEEPPKRLEAEAKRHGIDPERVIGVILGAWRTNENINSRRKRPTGSSTRSWKASRFPARPGRTTPRC